MAPRHCLPRGRSTRAARPALRCGRTTSRARCSRPSRERAVYSNALLGRDLGDDERATAVDAMEQACAAAGIDATPHGFTRATRVCEPHSAAAATRSTNRPGPWGCHSPTSPSPIRRSTSARPIGRRTCSTCASSALPRDCSAVPTPLRVTSCSRRSRARTWPPRSRSITTGTAAPSTSRRSKRRGDGPRNGSHHAPAPSSTRPRVYDGERAVDADGRARVFDRRVPRPGPHPRRAVGDVPRSGPPAIAGRELAHYLRPEHVAPGLRPSRPCPPRSSI
jgi:hypothetical protein